MLRVNLEKALLKQNVKIVTADELLHIQQYDKLGEAAVEQGNVLQRIGINTTALEGANIIKQNKQIEEQLNKFTDKGRIFHIDQIEKVCNKYDLRFLPSCFYKGDVPVELITKLSNFELINNVECYSEKHKGADHYSEANGKDISEGNTFIMAPAGSFELIKPKDPLLFYEIVKDKYYYLIYKWGNDLSWFRRIYSLLNNFWFVVLSIFSVFSIMAFYIMPLKFWEGAPEGQTINEERTQFILFFSLVIIVCGYLFGLFKFGCKNKWKSIIK